MVVTELFGHDVTTLPVPVNIIAHCLISTNIQVFSAATWNRSVIM